MIDLTLLERLSALIKVIFSTPFFITLFGFMVITIIVFSVYSATKNKISKIFLTISYALISSFLMIKYGKLIYTLFDTFVDQIFVALYFPNLISYICMVIISSILVMITIINKKIKGFIRVSNILSFTIIIFLFILTIDIISKNDIDLFDKTSIYSNQTLMILIQASMAVFACWVGLLIVDLVIELISSKVPNNVLEIFTKKEDEDASYMTEEDFYRGYVFYNKKKQYQEYINYDDKN